MDNNGLNLSLPKKSRVAYLGGMQLHIVHYIKFIFALTFCWLFSLEPRKHAELLIPQHAGSVLIFTPPGTPRRMSDPCIDASSLVNGHADDIEQPKVESEAYLMTTPQDFNFDAIELTIPSPFVNGEAPDLEKQVALQRMNDITDTLIETEEKYVDDLRSLAEVRSLMYSRLPLTRTFKGNRKSSSYRELEENSWIKVIYVFYCTVNILLTLYCRNVQ